jgi:hypothetical protein
MLADDDPGRRYVDGRPLFITLHRLRNDMIVPSDPAEQMEKAETAEPIEPIERTDPTEPIESTEPREAIDRIESCDLSDHLEVLARSSTGGSYFWEGTLVALPP